MASRSGHGSQEPFTFFFRHTSPFSQWYPATFRAKSLFGPSKDVEHEFANCEQWMMYNKALLFDDMTMATRILMTTDPATCKKCGRDVVNFNEALWNQHKETIVYEGNWQKFVQNQNILQTLLDTKGTTLVEASPYDRVWGIGLAESDPRARSRSTWRGANLLGQILTRLRDDLLKL